MKEEKKKIFWMMTTFVLLTILIIVTVKLRQPKPIPTIIYSEGDTRCNPENNNALQEYTDGKWEDWLTCPWGCEDYFMKGECKLKPEEQDCPIEGVIFIHSLRCPHCINMMPIIEELEQEGYEFIWAESQDQEIKEMVISCYKEVMSGYVPEFVCAKTKEKATGAMPKDELKVWIDEKC